MEMEIAQYYLTMFALCFLMTISRYGVTALTGFVLVKFVISQYRSRISNQKPARKQIRKEILYSVRSTLIFAIFWFAGVIDITGHSQMYSNISQFGWFYFGVSVLVLILLHDTFVYWTHRLMHHPFLFHRVHRLHHSSVHSTPFAIYLFDTSEAILHGLFFFAISLVLPLNWLAMALVLWIASIANVIGHLGYEPMPAGWLHSVGKIFNTTTHHDLHHTQGGRYNYGVYFRFWDWLMGTEHPDYQAKFAEAATKQH
jgi:sterol desaturase/sphingolipid hydroxylase (fatty acid hydroxylase superfamily)